MVVTLEGRTTENGSGDGADDAGVPRSQLYRLIDCASPLVAPSRHGLSDLDLVTISRGEPAVQRLRVGGQRALHLRVADPRMSSTQTQLVRTPGRWMVEDLGSRNGTLVNGAPVRSAALADGDLVEAGRTFFLFREAVPTTREDPLDLTAEPGATPLLGTLHPPLAAALRALRVIAGSTVSVILQGDTGTGKEVLARAIHEASGRSGAFVAVNCGAIPDSLIEAELFGARRGAYSDAREDRPGLVRAAHDGTLFLDEIGDLPAAQQAAFLRVLQEREVVPIGHTKPVSVDLRVVSATHRDLAALAASAAFREDLLSRLSGFTMTLPPLRARREDLGLIVQALIRRLAPAPDKVVFQRSAMRALLTYRWPRNVRELEKCLGAALVLAGDEPVQRAHLGDLAAAAERPAAAARDREAAPSPSDEGDSQTSSPPVLRARDQQLHDELIRLLGEHQGNLSAVARAIGKDRAQVHRLLRRLGIDPDAYRS